MSVEVEQLKTFGSDFFTRVSECQPTDIIPGERNGAPISMLADTLRSFILEAIADGSGVTFGVAAPDNASGNQGDIYIRTTGEIYSRSASTWDLQIDFVSQSEMTTAISAAIASHTHSAYLTPAQGDLRYPLQTATDPYPAYVTHTELAASEGDAQGGLRYNFNASTAFPAVSGQIRLNESTLASVTSISVHEVDRNSAAMAENLDLIALNTRIQIAQESDEEIYAWYKVSGAPVDNGSDRTIPVAFVSASGVLVAGEVTILFQTVGGVSSGGASGIKYTYAAAAGVGAISVTAGATLDAATTLSINATDAQSKTAADVLARLKSGAIVEIAKDGDNRVRYAVTADFASGSVNVAVAAVYGVIGIGNTVYLSIWSDAPIPGPAGSGSTITVREADSSPSGVVSELVFPDGSLAISGSVGSIQFATAAGLTANLTLYVRKDGNDTNSGLTNDSDGAFLTIQKAEETAANLLSFGAYNVFLQVGDGIYNESVRIRGHVGAGRLSIIGNITTPSTCIVSTNSISSHCFYTQGQVIGTTKLSGMRLIASGSNSVSIDQSLGFGLLEFEKIDFGIGTSGHIRVGAGAQVNSTGDYSISGAAGTHISVYDGGFARLGKEGSYNVAVVGSPGIGVFAVASRNGMILAVNQTYTGSATGKQYQIDNGGRITQVGGSSNFPGSIAGTPVANPSEAQVHAASYGYYVRG